MIVASIVLIRTRLPTTLLVGPGDGRSGAGGVTAKPATVNDRQSPVATALETATSGVMLMTAGLLAISSFVAWSL